MGLDYELFQVINNVAGMYPWLDFIFVTVTDFGVPLLAILALSYCKKKNLYKMLFAVWLVFVVDFLIKLLFFRPRPFVAHEVNLLVDHLKTASFPSRHTDIAFALAQSIFFTDKRLGVIALVIGALVAFSRIFVGVHYPVDVFVGAILGITGAFVAHKTLNFFWKGE